MINNYFTLYHLANELNLEFTGHVINEIFTQHRSELILSFNGTPAVIIIGCEPSDNYLYMRKTYARANRNSTDAFFEAFGKRIKNIQIHPADRQIHIRLHDETEIVVQLFGSKSNVLFVDEKGIIVSVFLKKDHIEIQKETTLALLPLIPTFEQLKAFDTSQPIIFMLKKLFARFGNILQRELITRTGLPSERLIKECTDNELERILSCAEKLYKEMTSKPSFRIYYQEEMPIRFSIIPLQQYAELRFQEYDSVSEAIQAYRSKVAHEKSYRKEKDKLIQVLLREYKQAERTLSKISEDTQQTKLPEQYELFGKLITANIHLLKKGDQLAVVEDIISGKGDLVEISLDPHLSPAKNAERYFEKARKAKHAIEEQKERFTELTKTKNELALLLEQIEEVAADDALESFIKEHRKQLERFGFKIDKEGHSKKEEPIPFRVFVVDGGFHVWVGKSAENNDMLSTRHTAKNDLWFHARGVGGSHVVLKIGTGKGEVSKRAIEQAAGIAAYYSKMKGSKLVPVSMCEGKFVHKPKGAQTGTVTIEREKTIFAEPKLP